MLIIGAAKGQIEDALKAINKKYHDNIRFKEFRPAGQTQEGKPKFNVTLTVDESRGPGGRLGQAGGHIAAACWHAHGDFMDALPKGVEFQVGGQKTHPGDPWVDRNIGSQVQPMYYSEACDCGSGKHSPTSLKPYEPKKKGKVTAGYGDVISLESEDEDIASLALSAMVDRASKGNKTAQAYVSRLWGGESWPSIKKKANVEGSTWYVWWMDGVRAHLRNMTPTARKETAHRDMISASPKLRVNVTQAKVEKARTAARKAPKPRAKGIAPRSPTLITGAGQKVKMHKGSILKRRS